MLRAAAMSRCRFRRHVFTRECTCRRMSSARDVPSSSHSCPYAAHISLSMRIIRPGVPFVVMASA